ncbi:MAG: rhomboid family intramembrane serine protease [Sedimentisphaerales bacterium]|nr:rhomboid family intramembrane serine protease [Sedimentisphaerales bacterium]
MRLIGQLQDEAQANRFSDSLYARGIESRVDPGKDGAWEIWVLDDRRIDEAGALLERFAENPDDLSFAQAAHEGSRQKQRDEKRAVPKRARAVDARTMFYQPPVGLGVLTVGLIAISVLVSIITYTSETDRIIQLLSISKYSSPPGLPEIRHGQVWRLFTPMFIHFGIIHLLFNMLWLRDLGSMIESRKGIWMLLALVLVLAATSNVGQYLHTGPNFGGMSGVVYGLLGYVWMQGRYNPSAGLSLHPQTVTMMIIWFFLCLTGLVGNIANTAHAVGAVFGIAWGFVAAKLATSRR